MRTAAVYGTRPAGTLEVGDVVIPDEHPAGSPRWRVASTNGVLVTLEALAESGPRSIRRDVRHVRKVEATS